MTPPKEWREQEERVAKLLFLTRNKRNESQKPDAEGEWLTLENNHRKRLPQWIVAALAKVRKRTPSPKIPIVTVTTSESSQILVIIDMVDFLAWFGGEI